MHPAARAAFLEMVRDCGEVVVRMPASCEMYLRQYLAEYDDEQLLLLDALKVGIPGKIVEHFDDADYASYLDALGPRFARAARRSDVEAAWAVTVWAEALARTPADAKAGSRTPAEETPRYHPEDDAPHPTTVAVARTAMAGIVAGGGFLGGALAALLLPVALYAAQIGDAISTGGFVTGQYRAKTEGDLILLFAFIGLVAGLTSAAASLAAWSMGRGAERPWATFSVACGTAFTVFFAAAFAPFILLPFKPVVLFVFVYGAVYKSAARGGHY